VFALPEASIVTQRGIEAPPASFSTRILTGAPDASLPLRAKVIVQSVTAVVVQEVTV
jgi:hypothetical protein